MVRFYPAGADQAAAVGFMQCFPKGTDFLKVTDVELRRVVNKLNDRPRKRLGYRTPAQVFLGEYLGTLNTAGAAFIS